MIQAHHLQAGSSYCHWKRGRGVMKKEQEEKTIRGLETCKTSSEHSRSNASPAPHCLSQCFFCFGQARSARSLRRSLVLLLFWIVFKQEASSWALKVQLAKFDPNCWHIRDSQQSLMLAVSNMKMYGTYLLVTCICTTGCNKVLSLRLKL